MAIKSHSPGRWHSALVIKMVLVQLMTDWDIRLQDENTRKYFFWETFQMPYESTGVLFKNKVR